MKSEKMSDDLKAKLKPYMDKGMSEEEAMKMYNMDMKKADEATAEELEIETLKAVEASLKEENERLRKSLIDNGYVIKADVIEKKVEPEYVDI